MINKDKNGEPKTITMSLKESLKILFVLLVGIPLCSYFTVTLLLMPYKTWGPAVEKWSHNHPIGSNAVSTVLFVAAMMYSLSQRPKCKCKHYENTQNVGEGS